MKAVVLTTPSPLDRGPLQLKEVAEPTPGPGEIVIQVRACGVCRSNLHMIEGDWVAAGVPAKTPIIPGHEVVGVVAAVGDAVDQLAGRRPRRGPTAVVDLRCLLLLHVRR